ncbi:alkaline phosphatase family protein [Vulgatibacter sp.]|uniref:alkaline phosphatase family protein n=1 Tax=Vulgatibacter sp. TaxID=1971226 RepID=UPI00356351A9
MIGTIERIPTPLLPQRLTLDALPLRPVVRRWAEATVRELTPVVKRVPSTGQRRLLAIFVDGLGAKLLEKAARDGTMPFLARLRDSRAMRETRTFSGMPSTTTAYQAGLFYGLRHPDVPAFNWLDRKSREQRMMFKPQHAAQEEARIRALAGDGLMKGGASYLSILRGGAADHLNTVGAAAVLGREELPNLDREELPALLQIHGQTAFALAARLAMETGPFLWDMRRFVREKASSRHEFMFLLNHLLVGTLVKEVAQGQAIVDLVRGVPRVFLNFHDFDEVSHRRGPDLAMEQVLRGIDHSVEAMFAIAAAVDDPVDVYVFSDHGQIEAVPFEREYGMTFADWIRGLGDGGKAPPELPRSVEVAVGASAGPPAFEPDLQIVDCGDYAQIYFEDGPPLDASAIVERHARTFARILTCPGVGLALVRHAGAALAFDPGGRLVDPEDPATVPKGCSPRGVAAALEELASSEAAGDVLVYGSWREGGCVSLSWEWSSHGGPSFDETENFLLHPVGIPFDAARISHAADLHHAFRSLYGGPA